MYGHVFLAVKDCVVSKFGEAAWLKILALSRAAPAGGGEFIAMQAYDDKGLYDVVAAACKVLNVTAETVLEIAGRHFIAYTHKKTAHGQLLELMGNNPIDILCNINKLHAHLLKVAHFPEIASPTFRCTNKKANSVRLHYTPGKESRVGLAPFVNGAIRGLVEDMLKCTDVTVEQIKSREKHQTDVFLITWASPARSDADEDSPSTELSTLIDDLMPVKYGLSAKGVSRLFPFHVAFDKECNIVQAGASLQKVVPMEQGDPMSQHFAIKDPDTCAFPQFRAIHSKRKHTPFTLVHQYDDQKQLLLCGEMVWYKAKSVMVFACSPVLQTLEEAKYFGIDISDFALCDQAQAHLLIQHAQSTKEKEDGGAGAAAKEDSSPSSKDEGSGSRGDRKAGLLRSFFMPPVSPRKKESTHPLKMSSDSNGHDFSLDSRTPPDACPLHVPRLNLGDKKRSNRTLKFMLDSQTPPASATTAPEKKTCPPPKPAPIIRNRVYHAFSEALLSDSWDRFIFIRTLLNSVLMQEGGEEMRNVFEGVVRLNRDAGKIRHLLECTLAADIKAHNQEEMALLFRGESVGVRLWSTFMGQEANEYRLYCSQPLFQAVEALDRPLEMHPGRVTSDTERDANAKKLIGLAQTFLDHVCASAEFCPVGVRTVMRAASLEVRDRWPHLQWRAIASLLFLRFLSPGIVNPAAIGQEVKEGTPRTLLLVSKMVNNLMNEVAFGDKEPFMLPLNSFLNHQNKEAVQRFVQNLTDEEAIAGAASTRGAVGQAASAADAGGGAPDEAVGGYRTSMAVDAIREALLRHHDAMWTSAKEHPSIEAKLRRLLTVALCDMPTEYC